MIDENKIYVGEDSCEFWRGHPRYVEKKCCGGRVENRAIIRCTMKGEVKAYEYCRTHCKLYEKREFPRN